MREAQWNWVDGAVLSTCRQGKPPYQSADATGRFAECSKEAVCAALGIERPGVQLAIILAHPQPVAA